MTNALERSNLSAAFDAVKAADADLAKSGVSLTRTPMPWQVLGDSMLTRLDVYDVLRIAWRLWNED